VLDYQLRLLAVHAHPDDETISTGGLLIKSASEGIYTALVCCTGGEEGEIRDPDLPQEEHQHRLAEIRMDELRRAAEVLRVADLRFLGFRDSGMAGTPANDTPENFHNADPEEVANRLVRVLREVRPQVIVTYDERGGYGHPDHIATHRATVAAFDAAADPARFPEQGLEPWQALKLYYAVWSRTDMRTFNKMLVDSGVAEPFDEEFLETYAVPDEMVTTKLDVSAYVKQKMDALRLHRTQVAEDDFWFTLPPELQDRAFSQEQYQRARSVVAAPDFEDDLFAGLR
jgi:mycothiol conjugate amidase Mca